MHTHVKCCPQTDCRCVNMIYIHRKLNTYIKESAIKHPVNATLSNNFSVTCMSSRVCM